MIVIQAVLWEWGGGGSNAEYMLAGDPLAELIMIPVNILHYTKPVINVLSI